MVALKRILLALALLCCAQVAPAQSFPVPDDILAAGHWGSDGWDEQPVTYEAGTTTQAIASTTTPVADTFEFAEVNAGTTTGWLKAGSTQCLTIFEGGTCHEAKFRTTISGFTHCLRDDPIRNFGQPGTSHLHCFFGNGSVNAYSTYPSLRNHALKSQAAGGLVNATGYWVPAMVKNIGGVNYVIKNSGPIIVYYAMNPAEADLAQYLLLGLRYVTGYNMDDGGAWLQSKLDAANAQPGTSSTRYRINNGAQKGTLIRWTCNSGGVVSTSDRIANADGSDAFGGNCPAGADFWIQFGGANCWDGRNFWSPGGYKHVIPRIYDSVGARFVCPKNWKILPDLQLQVHYPQNGVADRATMKLASDPVGAAPGLTFHTDWFNGWRRAQLRSWLETCIGVRNILPSRECDSSAINNTEALITDTASPSPPGRSPQVQTHSASSTDITKMWRWGGGTGDVHVHGGGAGMAANENLPAANDNQLTALAGAEPISFDLAAR